MPKTILDFPKLHDDLSLDDMFLVAKPYDAQVRSVSLRKVWELFWTSFYVLDRPTRPDPPAEDDPHSDE